MLKIKIITYLIISCFLFAGLSPAASCLSDNASEKEPTTETNTDDDYDENVYAYASFKWSPEYPDPGEEVTFYSTSSVRNGYIHSERWTFHDGSIVIGSNAKYTYEEKGAYKIRLEVRASGYHGTDSDSSTKYIKIGASPFPIFTVEPNNPSPGEQVTLKLEYL